MLHYLLVNIMSLCDHCKIFLSYYNNNKNADSARDNPEMFFSKINLEYIVYNDSRVVASGVGVRDVCKLISQSIILCYMDSPPLFL